MSLLLALVTVPDPPSGINQNPLVWREMSHTPLAKLDDFGVQTAVMSLRRYNAG
jgi:hypothetical protein